MTLLLAVPPPRFERAVRPCDRCGTPVHVFRMGLTIDRRGLPVALGVSLRERVRCGLVRTRVGCPHCGTTTKTCTTGCEAVRLWNSKEPEPWTHGVPA